MENITISAVYAKGIYDFAKDNNKIKEVLEMLRKLKILMEDNDVRSVIDAPNIELLDKKKFLNKLFDGFEIDIIDYLLDKRRIDLISEIYNEYFEIYTEDNDEVIVQAVFTKELTDNQRNKLIKKLEKMKNKKIKLITEVDENLIAGGYIVIGDEVIDGSILSQIKDLKKKF